MTICICCEKSHSVRITQAIFAAEMGTKTQGKGVYNQNWVTGNWTIEKPRTKQTSKHTSEERKGVW